ncbi:MAG: ZPR1 zinc finger domain-containing protein [Candidatus Woesearchaeota archaeon]|nr:ZPR1 zinc finger domain-containing protein [Candidatus Woesearchaeota archaeon]
MEKEKKKIESKSALHQEHEKEGKNNKEYAPQESINELKNQECPICKQKTCTLTEMERYIPWGEREVLVYLFSMSCSNCKYHKADVEFAEQGEPVKYSIDVSGPQDMGIRIIKSAEATVKIPYIITMEGGPEANGYITNIEGLLNRVKNAIEFAKENAEDEEEKDKARKLLKKINRVMWGSEKIKIIIEDKTGNSAIISEKAIKSKL